MYDKINYVVSLLAHRHYFNIFWHEEEEDTANRFFKISVVVKRFYLWRLKSLTKCY